MLCAAGGAAIPLALMGCFFTRRQDVRGQFARLMLLDAAGLRALGLAMLLSAALAACNRPEAERTTASDPFETLELLRPKIVTLAKDFTLPGLTEQPVRLADLRGQVVLLNFWATWCPPCREEMPSMERAYGRYRERGFSIVAISTDTGGAPTVAPFAESLKLTFPIALDPDMAVANEYRVGALPTTFLIDQDANVVARAVGPRDWDGRAAHALIESLLR